MEPTPVALAAVVLLSVPYASAAAAAQEPPVATVDADRACPSNDIKVTIDNPTQSSYQVT